MVRLTFRHITGSRATEIDEIQLGAHRELILGRGPSAAVRFDVREDTTVARHHARISWTEGDPIAFEITDLKSRRGTYVNGRLITTTIRLAVGDVIRLGANGPEVEVRWQRPTEASLQLIG